MVFFYIGGQVSFSAIITLKLLSVADENKYRDSRLEHIDTLSYTEYLHQNPIQMAQGTLWNGYWEEYKNQNGWRTPRI